VPCTEVIRDDQINRDYEEETAVQILETFELNDYRRIQAVLVASHGPFTWGGTAAQAVYHSVILEYIAEMDLLTIDPSLPGIKQSLLDKHFLRKHGENAYYGQKQ
jgi:L-ribulose-5-phosphate 4-epimerase